MHVCIYMCKYIWLKDIDKKNITPTENMGQNNKLKIHRRNMNE